MVLPNSKVWKCRGTGGGKGSGRRTRKWEFAASRYQQFVFAFCNTYEFKYVKFMFVVLCVLQWMCYPKFIHINRYINVFVFMWNDLRTKKDVLNEQVVHRKHLGRQTLSTPSSSLSREPQDQKTLVTFGLVATFGNPSFERWWVSKIFSFSLWVSYVDLHSSMVVSNIFYVHPYLGKWSYLTIAYFSDELVQPPTGHDVYWKHHLECS